MIQQLTATPALAQAPAHVVDPASPAHYAAAVAFVTPHARSLIRFLDNAQDLSEGFMFSDIAGAIRDWESWTDVAYGQSNEVDQDYDLIFQALEDLQDWQRAHEDYWSDNPGMEWDRDLEDMLDRALDRARALLTWRPVNPDTSNWTQAAWDRIDAAVQRAAVQAAARAKLSEAGSLTIKGA